MTQKSNVRDFLYNAQFCGKRDRRPLDSPAQWVNGLAFRNTQFSPPGMPVIKIAEIKDGVSGQTKFTRQQFAQSVLISSGDLLFSWSGQPETSETYSSQKWWIEPESDSTFTLMDRITQFSLFKLRNPGISSAENYL